MSTITQGHSWTRRGLDGSVIDWQFSYPTAQPTEMYPNESLTVESGLDPIGVVPVGTALQAAFDNIDHPTVRTAGQHLFWAANPDLNHPGPPQLYYYGITRYQVNPGVIGTFSNQYIPLPNNNDSTGTQASFYHVETAFGDQAYGNYNAVADFTTRFSFQYRKLEITNLRVERPIVLPESKNPYVKVFGDITVYPNQNTNGISGWTPTSDIHFRVIFSSPLLPSTEWKEVDGVIPVSQLHSPDNDGVVGSFEAVWDGRLDDGEFCFLEMDVTARALLEVASDRNTLTEDAHTKVWLQRCPLWMVFFNEVISLFGSGNLDQVIAQNGAYTDSLPESMGYGWFSTENIKIYDLLNDDTDLVYCDEMGKFCRWILNGSSYESIFADNHLKMERNGGSTDARYVVTWRDGTRREFRSDRTLRRHVDRNGNQTLYDNSNASYLKIEDGKGRVAYNHYRSGEVQPWVINDNVNPLSGRRYELEYYMNGTEQTRLKRITDPVGDSVYYAYSGGRLVERREELENHHRSIIYEYDVANNGRLKSVKTKSTLLHPSDPLLNEEMDLSQVTYTYNLPVHYEDDPYEIHDYTATKIVAEDLIVPENLEQAPAPPRTKFIAHDRLSRLIGEFEVVAEGLSAAAEAQVADSTHIVTLHKYNDPDDPLSVSSDPQLRTETYQVNKAATTRWTYNARGNVKTILDDDRELSVGVQGPINFRRG